MSPAEALGIAIATAAMIASLIAFSVAAAAFWTPRGELAKLHKRVLELATLRTEWEATLSALDSMNRRSARLAQKTESAPAVVEERQLIPTRRSLTLAEIQARKGA